MFANDEDTTLRHSPVCTMLRSESKCRIRYCFNTLFNYLCKRKVDGCRVKEMRGYLLMVVYNKTTSNNQTQDRRARASAGAASRSLFVFPRRLGFSGSKPLVLFALFLVKAICYVNFYQIYTTNFK